MRFAVPGFCAALGLALPLIAACAKSESVSSSSSSGQTQSLATGSEAKAASGPAEEESEPQVAADAADVAVESTSSDAKASSGGSDPAGGPGQGSLKIRFQYGGDPFQPEKLLPTSDQAFCGQHEIPNERLLVHPENRGIQNVVVYLYVGRGGSELPPSVTGPATVTLANLNCRFDPRVVLCRTGDTLKVTNPDQIGHNANFSFFNNQRVNFTIPAGREKSVELTESEPAPVSVDCNIHPWMRGYVLVLEHSFAAVSDANGDLAITGLPAGEKLVFRVFHEAGTIQSVEIAGQPVEWRRSRFEVDVQPGVNDLGTVVISQDTLKVD